MSVNLDNLRSQVLRSSAWLGFGSFFEQAFRFGRNMFLTRLLMPDALGVMAIVFSVGSLVESFTEIGIREALIQNPNGCDTRIVNAAFWISLVRAFAIYAVVFVVAPFIADFYRDASLTSLLRITLLSVAVGGTISPRAYEAMKKMRFRHWTVINHGGAIAAILLTLIIVFIRRDIWGLAIGFVSENTFRSMFSYIVCPFSPTLAIDRSCVRELLTFSKRAVGLPFLNFVFMRVDIFVIAKFFPAETVGLYSMALNLARVPAGFLTNFLGQLLMPTFSLLQSDSEKLTKILQELTGQLASLGLPALAFVFFCSRDILGTVYGSQYAPMSFIFSLAACVSLLGVLNAQITTAFYAKGVPHLHRWCVAVMAVSMVLLIYPFLKWFGLSGACFAALISTAVGYVFQILRLRHLTGFPCKRYALQFAPAAVAVVAVVSSWVLFSELAKQNVILLSTLRGLLALATGYAVLFVTPLRKTLRFMQTTE